MLKRDFYTEFVTALKAGWAYSLNDNLPDPDPILRKVNRDAEVYRELRADPKVAACVEQRKSGTLSLQWGLTLEEGQGQDKKEAERLTILAKALRALDMPRIISGILEASLWGYQPLEIMWELREGMTLPKDVIAKPPEWFTFDYAGQLKFKSKAHPTGEALPDYKFLLAQHQATFANPYGHKILPLCFWPVTFKKGGWRWWVSFTEKFGSPLLIGKYPRGMDQKEIDQLQDSLERLFQQAVASVPNDTQIDTITSGSADGAQHKLLIDQCNNEIALAILSQTLTSEIGANGSYAASKVHSDVMQHIVTSDQRMVERCLQQLVNWMYELNWDKGQAPRFSMWKEEDIDKAITERDKILIDGGVRFTKSYYQRVYGFQEDDIMEESDLKKDLTARDKVLIDGGVRFTKSYYKNVYGFNDDDFEVVDPQQQGAEFAEWPDRKRGFKPANTLIKKPFNPNDFRLDGKQFNNLGKALLASMLNMLQQSRSFEEVQEHLQTLYPLIDTAELQDSIARACYIEAIRGGLE